MSAVRSGPASISAADDRVLLGACCVAMASLVPISLFQMGLIQNLPDPPSPLFDSEHITSSREAHPLGIPDGLLGLGSFGATFALALAARRSATAKKLLGAKLTLDVSMAGFNAVRQVVSFGKLCSWCTATALATGVMAYAGRRAIRETWTRETWTEAVALIEKRS